MQRQLPRKADLKKAACWCFGFSAAAVLTCCRVLCRDRRGESSVQNWQKKRVLAALLVFVVCVATSRRDVKLCQTDSLGPQRAEETSSSRWHRC